MKKTLALLALPLLLALSACTDSRGWDAVPVGDSEDAETCYIITEWTNDFNSSKSMARGTFCPEGPVNTYHLPGEE